MFVSLKCTRVARPSFPPPPVYALPTDGSAYVCPLSEMNPTSCCSNHAVITFDPSIVCVDEYNGPCRDALKQCATLITAYIPSTLNYISYGMFTECPNLQAVYIQDGVVAIGSKVSY